MQTTSHVLMVRPVDFKFNQQTADNNKFQQETDEENVQTKALREFDAFVSILRANKIEVIVVDDTLQPETPDSIFPNNWVSFHETGEVILYPMFSANRRLERRQDIIDKLNEEFIVEKVLDLSRHEQNDLFLEGTGSLVLDRTAKIAYACRSLRTDETMLEDFCNQTGYSTVLFQAVDDTGFPIYHTNVMMCIAEQFAVICLDAIPNLSDKEKITTSLMSTGKKIVPITIDQMNHFAGNMLQLRNEDDERILVMSEQAYLSLSEEQSSQLITYNKIVTSPIYTIEKHGGGSARCMLAEIHLNTR